MADNKNKFSQKAFIVLKVKSMGVKESKDKVYNIYETKGMLVPDNVYFTISKVVKKATLETSSKQADFLNGKIQEFTSMMSAFQGAQAAKEDYYVSVRIAPSSNGTLFEQITSQRDDEGTVWFSASGFPSFLAHEKEDNEITLKFKTKDVKISEMGNTKIEVSMIVLDEADTQLVLSSGGDYPKELEVVIDDCHVGKAEIGQGYTFMLEFDKIENESNEDIDAWEEEAKPTYATTILKVKKVLGKVKGYVLEDGIGNDILDSYV